MSDRVPRKLLASVVVGLVVIAAIGIAFLAAGNTPAGLFLLILGPLFAALNLALIWAARRRVVSAGEPTGRTLARVPPSAATWSAARQAWTWTGGGNVPGSSFGRVNATMPLAVLELAGSSLTLRFRPHALVAMFGVGAATTWHSSDLVSVYPVRGRLVKFNRGLAIETPSQLSYFWTLHPERILAALNDLDYPVSWSEHYIKLLRF